MKVLGIDIGGTGIEGAPMPTVPAKLRNEAGIVGAPLAYEHERQRGRRRTAAR